MKKRKKIFLENSLYYVEDVRKDILEKFGYDKVYKEGLNIKTPLDLNLQTIATDSLRDGLIAYDQRKGWRGPLDNKVYSEEWSKDLKKFKLEYPINLVKDLSLNVLYLNKFGNLFFISGMKNLSRKVAVVVDGMLIDGSVNFVSTTFNKTSKITSTTQTGMVRNYVVYFGLFLLLLIALFIATPLVPR